MTSVDTVKLTQRLGELAIQSRLRTKNSQPIEVENLMETAQTREMEARQLAVPDLVAVALMRWADILLILARYPEAVERLQEARMVLKDLRKHDLTVQVLAKLAEAYGKQAKWLEVSSICEEGIKLVEQYRYKVTAPYMQSGYLRLRIGLYSWGVRAAYELEKYDLMLEWAELSKSRSTLRHQIRNMEPEKEITQLQQQFQQVCEQVDKARARGKDRILQKLLAKRRTLWDLLSIQRYRMITGEDLPTFSLAKVMSLLDLDEAIIYYYWLDKYTLLVVTIDQRRITPELRELAPEDRETLENNAKKILQLNKKTKMLDKWCKCWSWLLPKIDWLEEKRRLKRLIFSPHQLLHTIPFHAIPFHALDEKNTRLIQHFAVSYIPNLSSLLMPYSSSVTERVLTIGIRKFDIRGDNVPPLSYAEDEALEVAKLYEADNVPAVHVLGKEATEDRLKQLMQDKVPARFSCLHIATHGKNVPSDTPMESFLYLQNSKLDGLEIADLRFEVDLVVLSACCSGQRPIGGRGLEELPGDELLGLQAAFFAAGSRRLIATLWPSDGNATRLIMKSLHSYLIEGDSPEIALQRAVKDFLAEAGVNTRSTYYWASFFLTKMGRVQTNKEVIK